VDEIRHMLETGAPMPEGYDLYHEKVRPALDFVDPATGRPVHIERFGLLAQYLKTDHFTIDQWITFFAIDLERTMMVMRQESAKRGVEVSSMITVIDEHGTGFGIMSRMKLFQIMNHTASEYYPEFLSTVFVLRAPWVFDKLWKFIQGFLDPDTANKVVVVCFLFYLLPLLDPSVLLYF